MKIFIPAILLVTALAFPFPALAISQGDGHQQRIEQRCLEEPDRCEEIKSRFEEHRARMLVWCEENPQKCEERKARFEEQRAWCEQNPEECEARRAARRRGHERMRALCESQPEQCQALREEMRVRRKACHEDPAACPERHRGPSAN